MTEPDDDPRRRKLKTAVRAYHSARPNLGQAIVEARRAGVPQADVIAMTGLSREQVRRLEREFGFTRDA